MQFFQIVLNKSNKLHFSRRHRCHASFQRKKATNRYVAGFGREKGKGRWCYNVNSENKYFLEKYMEIVEPPDYLWWFEYEMPPAVSGI